MDFIPHTRPSIHREGRGRLRNEVRARRVDSHMPIDTPLERIRAGEGEHHQGRRGGVAETHGERRPPAELLMRGALTLARKDTGTADVVGAVQAWLKELGQERDFKLVPGQPSEL